MLLTMITCRGNGTDVAAAFPDVATVRLVDEYVAPLLGILKFVVSFGENDVFHKHKVGLQILLTVTISVNVRSVSRNSL